MKYLINLCCSSLFVVYTITAYAQSKYKIAFDKQLASNTMYSKGNIGKFASSKNAYNFMAMGYYLDANNIMYTKTGDIEYLNNNLKIVEAVLLNNSAYSQNKWLVSVNKNNQNVNSNGQQSLVFEGYFFRYLGDFLFVIKGKNLFKEKHSRIQTALRSAFDKWNTRSLNGYNDQSRLFHERLHIGANWAVVAMYLNIFNPNSSYKKFQDDFDFQLRKALKIVNKNGRDCYVWNSTYSDRFTGSLKKIAKYTAEVQDVTHGNHIVNYVLTANRLKKGGWGEDDLRKFSNTLGILIWNASTQTFSDNVDGSKSSARELRGTGWKQSDGWMKLMDFDTDLRKYYESFYSKNKNTIDKSSLGLQFIANLYSTK